MKVDELSLHLGGKHWGFQVIYDQNDHGVCSVAWGKHPGRTKSQAIAIAKRLCDRFNSGQEKKL